MCGMNRNHANKSQSMPVHPLTSHLISQSMHKLMKVELRENLTKMVNKLIDQLLINMSNTRSKKLINC